MKIKNPFERWFNRRQEEQHMLAQLPQPGDKFYTNIPREIKKGYAPRRPIDAMRSRERRIKNKKRKYWRLQMHNKKPHGRTTRPAARKGAANGQVR